MFKTLQDIANSSVCAIYNDLSHINPNYLSSERGRSFSVDEEVAYHKKNILLLSLYFDKIFFGADNLLAFSDAFSKDVVSSVVTSHWFARMVEAGIFVITGWGTEISSDMMFNNMQYASTYRPELKEKKYIQELKFITEGSEWIVREKSAGEAEQVNYLRPYISHNENSFGENDTLFLLDLIDRMKCEFGYVGSMETFPEIRKRFDRNNWKNDLWYDIYYASWHVYCAKHYSPAIPIHTSRVRLPMTWVSDQDGTQRFLAILYSPDVFQRYLHARFGKKALRNLLNVKVEDIIAIRNGDWRTFKEKYHKSLGTASCLGWLVYHPQINDLICNEENLDSLVEEIFAINYEEKDMLAIGAMFDTVLGAIGFPPFAGPIMHLLSKNINKRISQASNCILNKDIEPYLKKLEAVLVGNGRRPSTR